MNVSQATCKNGVLKSQTRNPSLSTVEPVSVSTANSCREKVWRGQRPAPDFWAQLCIPRHRDWPLSRFPRQSLGNLKTIPQAPGNRICAGLRGGAGRTQTDHQAIMSPEVIINGRRRALNLAGRTAVPSIWHRLRKRRHGGIVRAGPVNDRGQCTWRDERKWREKANVPFHLAFTLRDLGE
jgi:hypothetical protein